MKEKRTIQKHIEQNSATNEECVRNRKKNDMNISFHVLHLFSSFMNNENGARIPSIENVIKHEIGSHAM